MWLVFESYWESPEVRPPCEQDHGLVSGETAPQIKPWSKTCNFVSGDHVNICGYKNSVIALTWFSFTTKHNRYAQFYVLKKAFPHK